MEVGFRWVRQVSFRKWVYGMGSAIGKDWCGLSSKMGSVMEGGFSIKRVGSIGIWFGDIR